MKEVNVQQGGARFSATPEDAFKASMWLRSADRVLLLVKESKVLSFEDLFQFVKSVPWEKFIPKDARFPVTGKCARSRLMSVRDCQSITKKAIVERLRSVYKMDIFPETKESYLIDISIHNDIARLTIDASGDALNKRGYRTLNGDAAIRETLAAALVELSPWKPGMFLYDPCCGTGTLLIEAAMMATHRAPGIERGFAMEEWRFIDSKGFEAVRKQAREAFDDSADYLNISGSDIDPAALKMCKKHIVQADLSNRILVKEQDLKTLQLEETSGVFILNPPYGERLSDRKECEKLYKEIGLLLKRHPGFSLCVISSHPLIERLIGRRATKKRRLYNGRLECEYLIFQ
jgi:Predicted N6-adenine-specific DNA methylase